jgi:transcriptional regulator with XRE-family HTH domain
MSSQLVQWRERHGMTQKALADLLGKHVITISKWENGVREIDSLLPLALAELSRRIESGELEMTHEPPKQRGEAHHQAKFTATDIRKIRKQWPRKSINQIARERGVNAGTISKIVHRQTWKDVT